MKQFGTGTDHKKNFAGYAPLVVLLIFITVMVSVTFAYFSFRLGAVTDFVIGTVELNESYVSTAGIDNVEPNEKFLDSFSFSKNADSEDCFARVKLSYSYSGVGTLSAPQLNYLRLLNAVSINSFSDGSTYTWSRNYNGYYYLLDYEGNPLEIDDTTTYNLLTANGLVFPVTYDISDTSISRVYGLQFNISTEAIQSSNLPDTSLQSIQDLFQQGLNDSMFSNVFVAFDTDGGTLIDNQFITKGSLLSPTDPTRNGKVFAGWYYDEDLTIAFDSGEPLYYDTVLFAKWVE